MYHETRVPFKAFMAHISSQRLLRWSMLSFFSSSIFLLIDFLYSTFGYTPKVVRVGVVLKIGVSDSRFEKRHLFRYPKYIRKYIKKIFLRLSWIFNEN